MAVRERSRDVVFVGTAAWLWSFCIGPTGRRRVERDDSDLLSIGTRRSLASDIVTRASALAHPSEAHSVLLFDPSAESPKQLRPFLAVCAVPRRELLDLRP